MVIHGNIYVILGSSNLHAFQGQDDRWPQIPLPYKKRMEKRKSGPGNAEIHRHARPSLLTDKSWQAKSCRIVLFWKACCADQSSRRCRSDRKH